MKKYAVILVLFAAGFWTLLPSCSNPNQQETTQVGTTLQQPAEGGAVAQTVALKENEEGDEDENEMNENENAEAPNAATGDAKTTMINNLTDAFKGETTASAKYAAYAKKAQEEGYPQIALLFKATSASENIHANNHRFVLEDLGATIPAVKPDFTVKTTAENLKDAIAGESYEIATMYPDFIKNAQAANGKLALISLNYAYKTEQRHKPLYEKALTALEGKQVNTLASVYYVCQTCGNTFDGVAPKRCNISMTSSDKFTKIDKL
ncbi:MAG: rubrerythrin family protein [Saprospiraceae bacterium]|nr:rubrerythrin family protein [Saprospiraceae bacterium]